MAFDWGSGYIWLHTTLEGPWPHYMSLEVCWDGFWTLSFGLSQSHGHGPWLVCEVALIGGVFFRIPSKLTSKSPEILNLNQWFLSQTQPVHLWHQSRSVFPVQYFSHHWPPNNYRRRGICQRGAWEPYNLQVPLLCVPSSSARVRAPRAHNLTQ